VGRWIRARKEILKADMEMARRRYVQIPNGRKVTSALACLKHHGKMEVRVVTTDDGERGRGAPTKVRQSTDRSWSKLESSRTFLVKKDGCM
jgi:hypothetical protein